MTTQHLGIIMHGITGRMGYNQHLVRSICTIRDQGGVLLHGGGRVMPDPILVGRNAEKVAFGAVQAVSCLGTPHISDRIDEAGVHYTADADDADYATFQLAGGVVAQINSRLQWEDFIRHVVEDGPSFDLMEGAKGVQLAELGLKSWEQRRWLDMSDLAAEASARKAA